MPQAKSSPIGACIRSLHIDGGGLTPKAADHRQAGSHLSLLGVAALLPPPDQGLGL